MKPWNQRNLNIFTLEGIDEDLIVPSQDKRPTSDKINLKIPQAYGLSPSPQEKSLFRRHPFNPWKYDKVVSAGAEIGSYSRSPTTSLVALTHRHRPMKIKQTSEDRERDEYTGSEQAFLKTLRTASDSEREAEKEDQKCQLNRLLGFLDRSSTSECLE